MKSDSILGQPLKGWHGFTVFLKGALVGRTRINGLLYMPSPYGLTGRTAYSVGREICERYLCVPSEELHRLDEAVPGTAGQISYGEAIWQEGCETMRRPWWKPEPREMPDLGKPYLEVHVGQRTGTVAWFAVTGEAARQLERRLVKVPEEELMTPPLWSEWGFDLFVLSTDGTMYERPACFSY